MRDYKYGDLYFDTQHDKQMKIDVVGTGIVIDNSMIEMEAFELDETLCSESELKFGRCEANCVKFTARNLPGSINGKTINVTETIDGNTDEPFPYGKYKVCSDVPTSDRTKREITAYDAMYDIINADVKQWYAGLTFPMTLRQFRDSFFSHLGIIQKETTLVNDGMTVNKTLITESSYDSSVTEVDSISGKTVVEAICEINGVFGNINRDGLFEYVELKPIINPLYPANNLFPRDDLFPRDPNTVSMSGHYITFDYEDFQTKNITQLEIRPSDNTAGEKVGEAGNNYVISGNFLVSDKSGAELNVIAQNILEVIKKVSYTPIKSSSCVGNPCLELGDPIRFNTSREIVESYILQRTLTGIQAKRDSIESHGVEFYPVNNNGIKKRVEDVENRADSLEQTADEIQEEVDEFKNDTTVRFEKTENSIEAEVTRAQGAEGELSSRLSITESEISSEVAARQSADSEMSSRISQTAHSVSISASGSGNTAGITIALYDENGKLIDTTKTANITITGFVSFEDLENAGQTTINGANITTGNINCDRLNGGTINGQDIFGGRSAIGALCCIGNFYMVPDDFSVSNIDDAFRKRMLAFYMNSTGNVCFNNAIVANVMGDLSGTADMASKCGTSSYYVYFTGNNNLVPTSSDVWCGTSPNPFKGGYSTDGWKTTSDERVKKDFVLLADDPRFENMFYLLNPTEYKLRTDNDGMVHVGFTAQQVKLAMDAVGIRKDEFYGFHHEYVDMSEFETEEQYQTFLERNQGNNDTYSLCYEEFIALNTHMIQKQHKEIELLKQENIALQNILSILEQKMEVLENAYNNQNN